VRFVPQAYVRIDTALRDGNAILLCLDFDGTLTPIRNDPWAVGLPPQNLALLSRLNRDPRVHIAIISGRSLEDLRSRIHLEVYFAGNHGLEMAGPGLHYKDPQAEAAAAPLKTLTDNLTAQLRGVRGSLVENKGLSASVHLRNVAPELWPRVRQVVKTSVHPMANIFRLRPGNHIIEILPQRARDKGCAARSVLRSLNAPEVLTVCIGDDATDEDMFSALSGGITIRVGRTGDSCAQYRLPGCEEVTRFLYRVAGLVHDHPCAMNSTV
jgi:trehalose 6-phosphate phosphatase